MSSIGMKAVVGVAVGALLLAMVPSAASAIDLTVEFTAKAKTPKVPKPPKTPTPPPVSSLPVLQSWMNPDVAAAWAAGYQGKGVTITMVDEFSGRDPFSGNFGTGTKTQLHGLWTTLETSLLAPQATIVKKDFNTSGAVVLKSGLNVINMSYGMYASSSYTLSQIGWANEEKSIINFGKTGAAVISKAAGNDSVAVGAAAGGKIDFLDQALVGGSSVIFAGALTANGTTENPAALAGYSNFAGSNTAVQSHFLVVGVDSNKTGLAGTSFAAPVISGYAAIIGSKFKTATPVQITNQLLNTARTDTLVNYNATTYGRGEASLSAALAPIAIN